MEPIVLDMEPEADPEGLHAQELRQLLDSNQILAMHITGADGCGKTALMTETLRGLTPDFNAAVITADYGSGLDAKQYSEAGIRTVQVCLQYYSSLSSSIVTEAVKRLGPENLDLLIVEHTGNLMLATRSDLGISRVITCISVTQGWGPIEKYHPAYSSSSMNLVTKADLAQAVKFDIPRTVSRLKRLNPAAPVIVTSAQEGDGIDSFRSCISRVRQQLACEA